MTPLIAARLLLTYYLGIKVSQGKDCVEIKQERYARKILKEAGMEDCNATSYPIEKELKLRYIQSPRESHARAIKQILHYLKGTTSFGIKYNRSNDMKLVGYSDSSHNVDIDDGRSTTGQVFYLGTSLITWCSQNQTTMALSSCEAEFMAATATACQAIWLRELLAEVTGLERQKVIIRVDNKSAIALSSFMEGANISTLDITSFVNVWRMSGAIEEKQARCVGVDARGQRWAQQAVGLWGFESRAERGIGGGYL
ncbi:uncharacterized mitochondrial protein-like protein [Tanacetum coccineum]